MTKHIFLSPPRKNDILQSDVAKSGQIIYLFRDPRPWVINISDRHSSLYSSHLIFTTDLFEEFKANIDNLQRHIWLKIRPTGLASDKHYLYLFHNHIIRFLDIACLLLACAKKEESTCFYLGQDNVEESQTATSLSDLAIISIAARHICDHGMASQQQFQFMMVNGIAEATEHESGRASIRDMSYPVYHDAITVPSLQIDGSASQNRFSEVFDLTHVRTPLKALRGNSITKTTDSLLLVNKSTGIWGDISPIFTGSCEAKSYSVISKSQADTTIRAKSDERFHDLCASLTTPASTLILSELQVTVISCLPDIIKPLYISLEHSVQHIHERLVLPGTYAKNVGLHVSDINYIVKEGFARFLGRRACLSVYPHSFTTCAYQTVSEESASSVVTYCPFPPGLNIELSPRGVDLLLSYPISSNKKILPGRLKEIIMTSISQPKRDARSNFLEAGIFLGSEIEGIQIISNPLLTRDYVFSFCQLCKDLGIKMAMNIFPKTIFQSQDLMTALYSNGPSDHQLIVHKPSHTGIQMGTIRNLDCHLFWGHGSANLEATLMGIPAVCLNSIHDSIHLYDFDYTGYSIKPLEINSNMLPETRLRGILSKLALRDEGLNQQAEALSKMQQFLHSKPE